MRSRKTTQREIGCTKLQVHRNLHCLVLLNKKRENNQYTSPGTGMYKWERPCEITRVIHRQNERTELNFGPQPMLTLQKAVRRCAEAKPLFLLDHTWSILQKHLFDALKSQIHQYTIYIYLQQSEWDAVINQNRVDMSEHEWILPTSSLDSKANQASCAAAWLPSESATRRKEQWKTLRMQKSTYKQHWVFSCTDIWTFDVFCFGSTIILKVIKRDFFLACRSWRRSANTRCWWLGRNFWLHFRHGQHGLNHIVICSCGKRTESSKDEKQKNNTKGNWLHQITSTQKPTPVWCCWIRNEKTTSTLTLVLVCTSGKGLVKLPGLFTDRMKELNWTLAPSQCWLCRRLSGDALRQNLFFYLIILDPFCKNTCLMLWNARYINTLSTSIYSNLDGMR